MNIFYLDEHDQKAAEYHCDKHVVKMIVETAQMLSTAHHVLGINIPAQFLYKPTHKNHPCNVWVRETTCNYQWLAALGQDLCAEYEFRYGKIHACQERINALYMCFPQKLETGFMTPPALAMPEKYKIQSDPVQSYRNYYIGEKMKFAKWKLGNKPYWIGE